MARALVDQVAQRLARDATDAALSTNTCTTAALPALDVAATCAARRSRCGMAHNGLSAGSGSSTNTSSAAPAIAAAPQARRSTRASSTVAPRPTLKNRAVGRIAANASASKSSRVVRRQRQRVEHVIGAPERLVQVLRPDHRAEDLVVAGAASDRLTVIPRASARLAVARPIGPGPTTTRCLPGEPFPMPVVRPAARRV